MQNKCVICQCDRVAVLIRIIRVQNTIINKLIKRYISR